MMGGICAQKNIHKNKKLIAKFKINLIEVGVNQA